MESLNLEGVLITQDRGFVKFGNTRDHKVKVFGGRPGAKEASDEIVLEPGQVLERAIGPGEYIILVHHYGWMLSAGLVVDQFGFPYGIGIGFREVISPCEPQKGTLMVK